MRTALVWVLLGSIGIASAETQPRHGYRLNYIMDNVEYLGLVYHQSQLLASIAGIPEIVRGNLDVDIYSNPKCRLLRKCYTWELDALWPEGTIIATNDAHVGTPAPKFWSETALVNWVMHAKSEELRVERYGNSPTTTDQSVEALPFEPATVEPPFRNGQSCAIRGNAAATWMFLGKRPRGLCVLLPSLDGATVTVCECPPEQDVIDATHVSGGKRKPGSVVPYRGYLQVNRPGPDAVFVAVYVPFEVEQSPDVHAQWQPVAGRPDAVALRLDCDDDVYLVLHATEPGQVPFGDLTLEGRAAVARLQSGQLISLCLAAGTSAIFGDVELRRETPGDASWDRRSIDAM